MAMTVICKILIAVAAIVTIVGVTTTVVLVVNKDDVQDGNVVEEEEPTIVDPMLYDVGVGIADMTGPCVEITFMGYAELSQKGEGIHLRQFARSFIFVQGDTRVVLVITDVQAVGIAVRRQVVENLQELYGDVYSLRNVIVCGTHTHSTPGGHLVDFILDISIFGFSKETYEAYVSGITRSIVRAHENIVPARIFFGQTTVSGANMNRSPYSYEFNPADERARYPGNTDETLSQIRIVKSDGLLHGVLNFFAVHATSMNMTNKLVSSDNLGYAAVLMEEALNPGSLVGKPQIVAGFFTSNHGDTSPNILGARCEFSGLECDNQFVLCDTDANERCFALGPGEDMFDSTRIIATSLYEGAMEILNSPVEQLTGELSVIHQFVEMPEQTVPRYDPVERNFNTSDMVSGCVPALGYSFASGTIDGANTLNITQGTMEGNALFDLVGGIVAPSTPEDDQCHAPKPILLATGRANFPLPWHPRIVSATIIWLGGLAIAGMPGEPSTMTGRRIRDVVGQVMESRGYEPKVVVTGLTNEYIHYIATPEEYQVQRYEAASTIYGPHTLDIFLNKFSEFTQVAIDGGDVEPGPTPPDYKDRTLSLILPVIFDTSPSGYSFGDVMVQPPTRVAKGQIVSATFVGANPRNDLKHESSHAVVERLEAGQWTVIATDASFDTRFHWERLSTLTGTSQVHFEWHIPASALTASHRLTYYGVARGVLGGRTNFTAHSNEFNVV